MQGVFESAAQELNSRSSGCMLLQIPLVPCTKFLHAIESLTFEFLSYAEVCDNGE
jgi:hypothetical protein